MRYDAVLFDLLSGLLDSWSLWNGVAGNEVAGYRWRDRCLALTARAGAYRPYDELIAQAAADVGLPASATPDLLARWPTVRPWPEVPAVLAALAGSCSLGVVTNCSDSLATAALPALTVPIGVVVTAERVGWFKPDARPYASGLEALDLPAERVLYVAGSPFDVQGATKAGMDTLWHNRRGVTHSAAPQAAMRIVSALGDVPAIVAGGLTG